MTLKTTVIRLKSKPSAEPSLVNFAYDSYDLPSELEHGYVIVKALWISVDPYIRGALWKTKKGSIITSPQIAQVIRSNDPILKRGDIISGMALQWSTYSLFKTSNQHRVIMRGEQVRNGMDLSPHLGPLGLVGITAYQGLFDIANLQKGENVFVSGAAGAVGSIVGQIAKHVMGCTVVGTAGSNAKCKWLTEELGFDAAINYKEYNDDSKRFQKDLGAAFGGKGVDVYFDNTGGFQTESIWDLLKYKGRVVVCGQIANYNRMLAVPKIDDFLYKTIYQHIRIEGFSIHSFRRYKDFYGDMTMWMKDGKVQFRKTVKYGLYQICDAFMGLFSGLNFGKMLVKMGDPDLQSPSKL